MLNNKGEIYMKNSNKTESAAASRKVATYIIAGVIIFTMVFSVFATLVAAIK